MTSQRKLGAQGAAVLVQEFLAGEEFVIDQVTRDDEHKTVMVWVYEKAPANGAQFVYYNMRPVPSDSAVARQLVAYTSGCLDAIQIRNGATHSEVMMTADGPCLVEVNCRCGGFNGSWVPLATALTGYSQVTCLLDAFVDDAAYDALPSLPAAPFKMAGCNPFLVSKQEGVARAAPGFDAIAKLPSCVSVDAAVKVGDTQRKTIDLFTQPASASSSTPTRRSSRPTSGRSASSRTRASSSRSPRRRRRPPSRAASSRRAPSPARRDAIPSIWTLRVRRSEFRTGRAPRTRTHT